MKDIDTRYESTRTPQDDRNGRMVFRVDEGRGDHRQFHHPIKRGTVTVAGKPGIDIPPGTLNSILKQAGLKE